MREWQELTTSAQRSSCVRGQTHAGQ